MAVFGRMLRGIAGQGARDEADTLWVLGDGRFGIAAVGESNYQDALEELAGGRKRQGVNVKITAELTLENDNRYDSKAVVVKIDGRKVGYLSRSDARSFREEVADRLQSARRILCRGRIRGGWDRGPGNRGHFGVTLDAASGE